MLDGLAVSLPRAAAIAGRRREDLIAFGSSAAIHALLLLLLVGAPRYVARYDFAGGAQSFEVALVDAEPIVAPPAPPRTDAPPSSDPGPAPAPRVRVHSVARADTAPVLAEASPTAPIEPDLSSAPVLAAPTSEEAELDTEPGAAATSDSDAMLLGSAAMGRGLGGVGAGRGRDGDGSGDGERATTGAGCGDGIDGVWTALQYSEYYRDWHQFTLHIERRGDTLVGEIVARWWDGGPSARAPGPCRAGGTDYQYRMAARGYLRGDRVSFFSTSFERDHLWCGRDPGYNRDAFRGTLSAEEDRLEMVNDDGGRTLHEPVHFHRAGCSDSSR